jgi:two-component system response regulator YesN
MIKEINSKLDKEIEMKQSLQKLKTIKSMSGLNKLLEGIMQSVIDDYKKSDITDYIVMKATNYIKEHYKESIGLEEISQMLGITPVYLSSQFNKIVGINFTQFVKELRMNEAKKLLMTTDMKLYVIGEKVGYQDPKYFCRVFKEICGISPKIYKEMNAKR